MAYKSICTIVTDPEVDGPALDAAAAIAARAGAHLDVHCIGLDMARYDAIPLATSPLIYETGLADARDHAATLAKWAEARLPADLLQAAVIPVVGPQLGLDQLISRQTRYADLVVASQPYGPGRSQMQVAAVEAVLFGAAAPVLVLPAAGAGRGPDPLRPQNRVVIAWDESAESLAAIRLALPVLRQASRVELVMVDPPGHSPERSDPGGQVTLMLARHGVRVEVSILSRTLPRVSEVIGRFAREHGADLVVMGAYGHSRFREALLGGATREMLENAETPLFMAH